VEHENGDPIETGERLPGSAVALRAPIADGDGAAHRGKRQAHREGGTMAETTAVRFDRSAMQLDQVSDDGEPQPEPTFGARARRIRLTKALEDVRQERRIDAATAVAHADLRLRLRGLDPHLDAAVLGREFDRVGKQVPDDLLQAASVARDRAERG